MPHASAHTTSRELQELATPRSDVYRFLSSAFLEPPSREMVRGMCRQGFAEDLAALFDPDTVRPLVDMAGKGDSTEELCEEIRREFMNLFKIPTGQYITPYESVFCDERKIDGKPLRGLLMGPSAVDVTRFYRMAAMKVAGGCSELPDHVGLELHYLSRLCSKEQEFATAGDEAKLKRAREMERDFLAAHLTRWLPKLRDRIHQKSRHAYYRAVADMAVEFAHRDLTALEDALGAAHAPSAARLDETDT